MATRLADKLQFLSSALNEHDPHWAKIMAQLALEGRTIGASVSPSMRHNFGVEVRKIFGGMGSFNDISLSDDLERQRGELYAIVEDYLRETWKALGREVNSIPADQVIPVGASVEIVAGEVVRLDDRGNPEHQKHREGPFEVLSVLAPDMTNMPMYVLGRASDRGWENRLVRHNALRKIAS